MTNRWGNNGKSDRLYFLGLQDHCSHGDCSHEIKRHLLLGRKAMTNLDSILKSRDITLRQSWTGIWRTDAEAEAPILWPPDVKNWLIWKDPYAGKDRRQEEKGMTENEMVGWHHRLNGHENSWWTGKPGVLQSMGLQRVRHDWVTELNWTDGKKTWKRI